MRSTRIAAVAAGVALMTGLTACGSEKAGGGGGDDAKGGGSAVQGALAALKKASTATEKQNSAKASGVQKQSAVPGKTLEVKTEGAFDWSSGGIQGEAQVTVAGQQSEVRYLSDGMYMKSAKQTGGKPWSKIDYDELAKQGPSGALMKDQAQNNNPARSVQLLLASGKVKAMGEETVRGKKTTHYTGTLTLSELVRMQSKDLSESDKKALEKQFKQAGLEKEKIDLWIDEDDLLVKKREVAKTAKGTGSDGTVYYSDYGTEVDVQAPPASQVSSQGPGAGAARS
ncbi:hypothetical protein [Streptomyces sp. PU-14G]|uniref:hypothetical protein n=1 Tax=Streptomyces sp. PU-14G TaxID=2800808 RepID=UPI0034DF1BC2